eukprot:TRINITY_DN1706_c0_g2_i2.p1 TRINITY_DN1706_c0_g2~~TRINITY_DN1706_c0_g2_i2.p1  ORF type:complete len:321 (-),score=70.75 TRINITY_DN1706_c0_g2_i2:73-1035(-)
MKDITDEFFKSVNQHRAREGLGKNQHILKPVKKSNPTTTSAIEILKSIKGLNEFLQTNRMSYLSPLRHLPLPKGVASLTEQEKDEIDRDAFTSIESCDEGISKLEQKIKSIFGEKEGETTQHLEGVIFYLRTKLAEVMDVYRSHKRERTLRQSEESVGYIKPIKHSPAFSKRNNYKGKEKEKEKEVEFDINNLEIINANTTLISPDEVLNNITPEQKGVLEMENANLMSELETVVDQIRAVDTLLSQISDLFDRMSPHLVEHREKLESIHTTAVNSTQNLERGNKALIQASKRSVDFRGIVFLFLIVSSLSLLFLNWYRG